ncbi:hypothetical protein GCM10020221_15170 [Streptomyces thioluteus]|uniref:Uncharacterized protein n=1 Tax=Streptomyces thioluteus TaxID=66431 RepID=A0ABP6J3L1_STRTU
MEVDADVVPPPVVVGLAGQEHERGTLAARLVRDAHPVRGRAYGMEASSVRDARAVTAPDGCVSPVRCQMRSAAMRR